MGTVLAFGTFDAFHMGHDFLLTNARAAGDRLVVAVARDAHVRTLKGHDPVQSEQERLERVRRHPAVDEARLCDKALGSYEILEHVRPDVIAIGFDQSALRDDISRWMAAHGVDIQLKTIGTYV